jgi:hypothetical protein
VKIVKDTEEKIKRLEERIKEGKEAKMKIMSFLENTEKEGEKGN